MNKAIKELQAKELEVKRERYKNVPEYALSKMNVKQNANGLTQAIINWLTLNNHFATRVSSAGRYLTREKIYIPSTTRKGSADIHAIINGIHVSVEVKIGKDKMSEAQIKMKAEIERAGGCYYVAKDFESFLDFYKSINNKI